MEARKRKGRAALSLFLAGVLLLLSGCAGSGSRQPQGDHSEKERALLLLEPEKPSGYFPVQKTGNWKMC